jgi:hypothetical protein
MTARVSKRAAAKQAVDTELAQESAQELARELALAEERGAARVREQLRAAVDEYRRVVRVSDLQVEVVEAAALDEILKGK